MNDTLMIVLALLAGTALGMFYFGGLWLTVVKGLPSKSPGLWFTLSLILRLSLTLTGFYLICGEHWNRWLACLLGFIIARFFALKVARFPKDQLVNMLLKKDPDHES